MGWITDEGLHEGYLLPEFPDGQRPAGVTTGAVPHDQIIIAIRYDDASHPYVTRPAAEAIGWRVMCDCRSEHGGYLPESQRWASQLLVRVPAQAFEDLSAGRIFADDTDVAYVGERDDVEEAVRGLWWRQHAGRADALTRVERARARVVAADRDLDDAVAAAQAAGADARAINRAAGIRPTSRQGRGGPLRQSGGARLEGWIS